MVGMRDRVTTGCGRRGVAGQGTRIIMIQQGCTNLVEETPVGVSPNVNVNGGMEETSTSRGGNEPAASTSAASTTFM